MEFPPPTVLQNSNTLRTVWTIATTNQELDSDILQELDFDKINDEIHELQPSLEYKHIEHLKKGMKILQKQQADMILKNLLPQIDEDLIQKAPNEDNSHLDYSKMNLDSVDIGPIIENPSEESLADLEEITLPSPDLHASPFFTGAERFDDGGSGWDIPEPKDPIKVKEGENQEAGPANTSEDDGDDYKKEANKEKEDVQIGDSGRVDSGIGDSRSVDYRKEDSGAMDAGTRDSGRGDAGIGDSSCVDPNTGDSGEEDAGIGNSGGVGPNTGDSGRMDPAIGDSRGVDAGIGDSCSVDLKTGDFGGVNVGIGDFGTMNPETGDSSGVNAGNRDSSRV